MSHVPIALTIAGFDTCAGAGIQADTLTFHRHGFHALTAMTSLVVETPLAVSHAEAVSPKLLSEQLHILLNTYQIASIKIGLLACPEQVSVVAQSLANIAAPIVLDPVGIASTGSRLQDPRTPEALITELAPLATVITPNLPEACQLMKVPTGSPPQQIASQLAATIGQAVLLTGGHHGSLEQVTDLLATTDQRIEEFSASRIPSPVSLHGTGCVLSSALAAALGRKLSLHEATCSARQYLRESLTHHLQFEHSEPLLALSHFTNSPLDVSEFRP